jgi:hypothetical protein
MAASASEVRQYAVAACAMSARKDQRTSNAFVQAKAQVMRAFAGNHLALTVIGQIPDHAAAVADARRHLQTDPLDTSADRFFNEAVQLLEASTQQLIELAEQRP